MIENAQVSVTLKVIASEATGQEASSERESLDDDDVERNADLRIFNFNHEVAQY